MIVEGTAVYFGKDVAGDWVPIISFRYSFPSDSEKPAELQQAWYNKITHKTEWRGIPQVIEG